MLMISSPIFLCILIFFKNFGKRKLKLVALLPVANKKMCVISILHIRKDDLLI
jgi:hypothetical protein